MPDIVSDIVDVYVFRRLNARIQFLLLQRKANVPLGNTWQSFHTQIQGHESTIGAARRAVRELAGLNVSEVYSADYINEFFDDTRDVVVLAPVLAVHVSPQAPVTLGAELKECAWWDTNQAVARLPFAGQRWAARHIDELMSAGLAASQLYRLQLPDETAAEVRSAQEDVESVAAHDEASVADSYSSPDSDLDFMADVESYESFDENMTNLDVDEASSPIATSIDADPEPEPHEAARVRTDVPERDE